MEQILQVCNRCKANIGNLVRPIIGQRDNTWYSVGNFDRLVALKKTEHTEASQLQGDKLNTANNSWSNKFTGWAEEELFEKKEPLKLKTPKTKTPQIHRCVQECVHLPSAWWTLVPCRLCWWSIWNYIQRLLPVRSQRFPTPDHWNPGRSLEWSSTPHPVRCNRPEF